MPNYRDNEEDREALRAKVEANIAEHKAKQAAIRQTRELAIAKRFRDALRELLSDTATDEDIARLYRKLHRMLT